MGRWFLNADDNPDSHLNVINTFWPIHKFLEIAYKFIPWDLH